MVKKLPKNIKKEILNLFLVIIGTFLLSFGSVIFLTECELVAGGISGIAVIIQHFVGQAYGVQVYDYLIAALMVITWIIGRVFVGKEFAYRTLISSLCYIAFNFTLVRVPFFNELAKTFAGKLDGNVPEIGNLILCGVFGGVFVGGGVAITFLGGGSTGGTDVFQFIIKKHLGIKESISSPVLDFAIILIGMISMRMWNEALCGILSSVVTAMLIEVVYIKNFTAYQVDIISDKWKDISKYAQDELGRGATIIRAEGGYKGEERIILRVVFDRNQYDKIREYIATIDPKAFITFTQTNAVYGEGFTKNKKIKKKPRI